VKRRGCVVLAGLGNGGYDTQHYDLTIDYDPVANSMSSTTAITALATQNLSEFSLDLRGLTVTAVTVDGAAAAVAREADKLIVTPASGINSGATFTVVVAYNGIPQRIQDPDTTRIRWRAT
jgi:aminopeptidase N